VFRLPLEKPAIKISPSALAWRGPGRENPLLADLKPAFDAFRAGDYQRADDEFSKLTGKYPPGD
jgi:TolA-binding protein